MYLAPVLILIVFIWIMHFLKTLTSLEIFSDSLMVLFIFSFKDTILESDVSLTGLGGYYGNEVYTLPIPKISENTI